MHCTSSGTLHGGRKIGTGHTISCYTIYLYCVPHPDLYMEDGWLCLAILYFTMLSPDTHMVEGAAGFMILLLYYILSCLWRPFLVPIWPYLPFINILCIQCMFSHKSKTYLLGPTWGKEGLQTMLCTLPQHAPTHDSPWNIGGMHVTPLLTK